MLLNSTPSKVRHLVIFFLLFQSITAFSQVTFIGFDRNTCVQPMTNTYTFTNYSVGGGGSGTVYGYTVYRNGAAVFSASGNMGDGKSCIDLVFLNDSVGFLVYYSGNTSNRVLRTSDFGQSWNDVGGGAPNYFGLYVATSHIAYLVTQWNTPPQLYVCRCSDVPTAVNATFIYDTSVNAGLFATDTLSEADHCGQDSLLIQVRNGADTISYHIAFVQSTTGVSDFNSVASNALTVYPNPARDYLRHSSPDLIIQQASLLDAQGRTAKRYDQESTSSDRYPVAGLPPGSYLLEAITQSTTYRVRVLVIQ
ncbi:MAG: T9SS type A sorting domain-containing protein [Bacteroidota bacterium]